MQRATTVLLAVAGGCLTLVFLGIQPGPAEGGSSTDGEGLRPFPPDSAASSTSPLQPGEHLTIASVDPERAGQIASAQAAHSISLFRDWVARHANDVRSPAPEDLAEGRRLALTRRAALRTLIREHPRAALELSVPIAVRANLPPEIQECLERPINAIGSFEVFATPPGNPMPIRRFATVEGESYEATSSAGG